MNKETLAQRLLRGTKWVLVECLRTLYPKNNSWEEFDKLITSEGDRYVQQEAWNRHVAAARPKLRLPDYDALFDSEKFTTPSKPSRN